MIDIALEAAVREPRRDLSHVTLLDRLATQRAERLRARGPAIHQNELHVASLCDASGIRWLSVFAPGLGGGYGHLHLRADMIPFRAPVLVPPVAKLASQLQMSSLHRMFIAEPPLCSPRLPVVLRRINTGIE
jgi:hypothetical protein